MQQYVDDIVLFSYTLNRMEDLLHVLETYK